MIYQRNIFCMFVLVLFLFLPSAAICDQTADPNPWPTSIQVLSSPDGRSCYGISGLYGFPKDWSRINNKVYRWSPKFTESDSLRVDMESEVAWIISEHTRETLPELVNWLARYNGFIPTWEELLARDTGSPSLSQDKYKRIAYKELDSFPHGTSMLGPGTKNEQSVIFRFYENPYQGPKIGIYELSVFENEKQEISFSFGAVEEIDKSELYSSRNRSRQKSIKVALGNGETGTAKLNKTTAHCTAEMKYALRIYDHNDLCIWSVDSDIYGDCGIWNLDFDLDGVDEIIVLMQSHGQVFVLVYGLVTR